MGPSSRLGVCRGLEPSGADRPQGGAGLAMARTQSDRYKSSPGQRDCAEFASTTLIWYKSSTHLQSCSGKGGSFINF